MRRIVPFKPGIKAITKKQAQIRSGVCREVLNRWIEEGELTIIARPKGIRAIVLESSLDEIVERINAAATVV